MTHVTDTHSLVWLLARDPRLSRAASTALQDPALHIVVPAIVLAEVRFLHAHRRITIDLSAVLTHLHGLPNWSACPVDEEVVKLLPATLNIHDGIIVATALYYRDVLGEPAAVITKDTKITASGLVTVLW
jgi:PIN domain nuclease of toxin-antitoxin system